MKIRVTEQNIGRGIRRSTSQCPIAKAIRENVKPDTGIVVDINFITLTAYDGYRVTFTRRLDTPESAERFIIDFDDLGESKVSPFEFDLSIPEEFLK